MSKLREKTIKTTIISSIIIVYILMATGVLKRSSFNKVSIEPKSLNSVKDVIGYSMEHQIWRHLETFQCDTHASTFFNVKPNSQKTSISYDSYSDIFVANSFVDTRLDVYTFARTVALIPSNTTHLFCQIWDPYDRKSMIRKAMINKIWSKEWNSSEEMPYIPALISCVLSSNLLNRTYEIAITKERCPSHVLAYSLKKSPVKLISKKSLSFLICVKPLTFDKEISEELRQWLKIQQRLGVNKVIIYYWKLRRKTLSFLRSFNNSYIDLIRFVPDKNFTNFNRTFEQTVWLKRKLEILAYNDCFYRNLGQADFVIPLDVDEIIVPKNTKNFNEMLKKYAEEIKGENWMSYLSEFSSILVKNVYFFKKYEESHQNLVKVSQFYRKLRSFVFSPGTESSKSFISVNNSLTVFNHFSVDSLDGLLRHTILPTKIAQLNHYRDICDETLIQNCSIYLNKTVYDDSLIKLLN